MTFKLPVVEIIKSTFVYLWEQKMQLLSAVAMPTFFFTLVIFIGNSLKLNITDFVLLVIPLTLLAFAKFAIACHRLVIIGHSFKPIFSVSLREVLFVLWLIVTYIICNISLNLILHLMSTPDSPIDSQPFLLFLALISSYLMGRFSIIFPAIAVDKKVNLKWAWNVSKGNGFRMVVIVALLPLLVGQTLGSFVSLFIPHTTEPLNAIQLFPIYVVSLFILLMEVTALSFSYKAFSHYYTSKAQESESIDDYSSE